MMKRCIIVLLALVLLVVPCFAEYDLTQMTEDELQELINQAQAQLDALTFDLLVIRSDHVQDGYITVRKTDVDIDCKVIVSYRDINLQYDLNGDESVCLPLQYGSGEYTIYLGVPADVNGEKEPGHEYKELRIDNTWGKDGPAPVICYDILDTGVLTAEIDDPYACFLHPNCYVIYDNDSPWVGKAAELSADQVNNMGKFSAITEFVYQNCIFDYIKSVAIDDINMLPDINYVWDNRMGISQDISALTCAMLRSQGIPAMLVYGEYHNFPHYWVLAKVDGLLLSFDPTASLNAVSPLPIDFLRINPITVY